MAATHSEPQSAMQTQSRLIRIGEVTGRTGLSKPTIYRGMADKTFPRPVKYGRMSLWPLCEVDDWINARKRQRDEMREQG